MSSTQQLTVDKEGQVKPTESSTTSEPKKLSKAEAAKKVARTVPVFDEKKQPILDKDGTPKTKQVAIAEDEVLSFAEYPDRVVVVTIDGQKLSAAKK